MINVTSKVNRGKSQQQLSLFLLTSQQSRYEFSWTKHKRLMLWSQTCSFIRNSKRFFSRDPFLLGLLALF